MKMTEDYAYNL